MKTILIIAISLYSSLTLAAPAGTKGEDGNFKMSEKSLKHLGVNFVALKGNSPWSVPKEALVTIKLTKGVYRRFQGEITHVIVKTAESKDGNILIQSEDLESGDEVAISGVKFLRMTETDLNSETVDNCAH